MCVWRTRTRQAGRVNPAAVKCSRWSSEGSHRLITQCPAHDSRVGRLGKSPLPLSNEALDSAGQLTTIDVANRTGFKLWNHRKCALNTAMHTLRIPVVKMRTSCGSPAVAAWIRFYSPQRCDVVRRRTVHERQRCALRSHRRARRCRRMDLRQGFHRAPTSSFNVIAFRTACPLPSLLKYTNTSRPMPCHSLMRSAHQRRSSSLYEPAYR
jgi:hypothetical protein